MDWWDLINEYELGNGKKRPFCDLSYFKKAVGFETNGLRIGPWELSRYGVTSESLQPFQIPKYRKYLRTRATLHALIRATSSSKFKLQGDRDRNLIRSNADLRTFAHDRIGISVDRNSDLKEVVDCCALHIRRGDFVQVSSHLVSHKPT